MNKSITALKTALYNTKGILINAMTKVVMEYGENFHDYYNYYYNEFGICEEETEENTKVLKIIDMFNNGGCCFPNADMHHITTPSDEKESEINWYACAFWGLYVVEEDQKLHLKYYLLWNVGVEYDSDVSEPDHNYANYLSLQELEKLSEYLLDYVSQRSSIE